MFSIGDDLMWMCESFRALLRFDTLKTELANMVQSEKHRHLNVSHYLHRRNNSSTVGDDGVDTLNSVTVKDSNSWKENFKVKGSNVMNQFGIVKNVQYEKMNDIKLAFSEFYLNIILLKNYQTLNFTAFRKILKKHDKLFETTRGQEWRYSFFLLA